MRGSVAKRIRRLAQHVTNPERDLKRGWYSLPRNLRRVKNLDAAIAEGKRRRDQYLAERARRAAGEP